MGPGSGRRETLRSSVGALGQEVDLHCDVVVVRHPPLLAGLAHHPRPAAPDVEVTDPSPRTYAELKPLNTMSPAIV